MNGAFTATALGIAIGTTAESFDGIVFQSTTFGAKLALARAVMMPAIYGYHPGYCLLLAFDMCHNIFEMGFIRKFNHL